MLRKMGCLLKKIITSSLLLYAYNYLCLPLNLFIPINVITLVVIGIFGGIGLVGLIFLSFFL